MPKTSLRLSLNADTFPFLYRDAPRTVVVPGLDPNIRSPYYYGAPDNRDWGIPQMIFCENVLPISHGYLAAHVNQLAGIGLAVQAPLPNVPAGIGTLLYQDLANAASGNLVNYVSGASYAQQGFQLTKTAVTTAWDCSAYGLNAIVNKAFVSGSPGQTNVNMMLSLIATDPSPVGAVLTAPYSLEVTSTGTIHIFEGGVDLGVFGTGYVTGDSFVISYDGVHVKYIQASFGILRIVSVAANQVLFGLWSIFNTGGIWNSMKYNVTMPFDRIITLRDSKENTAYFSPAGGASAFLDPSSVGSTWVLQNPYTSNAEAVTSSTVNGVTFILYARERLLNYTAGSGVPTITDVTTSLVLPSGTVFSQIRGMGTASNYNLIWTDITILWSSPSDPLNFNNVLNNGSGLQIPQDVRGQIVAILPCAGGAIVYTRHNAVAMQFTNNAAAPFIFRGIANAGGIADPSQVASLGSDLYHYTYGSGGLQKVSLQQAVAVFPEVTDFLTSGWYETYDYVNHKVNSVQLGSYLSTKLTYIGDRYLVISYGQSAGIFNYALVYDTASLRWGKIKFDHLDCFEYRPPNYKLQGIQITNWPGTVQQFGNMNYAEVYGNSAVYQNIAGVGVTENTFSPNKNLISFLQPDGTLYNVVCDYLGTNSTSVVIIGKIQHNRQKLTTLHQIEIETFDFSSVVPAVYTIMSMDGLNISEIRPYGAWGDYAADPLYKNWLGDAVAKTHQIVLEGSFQLTTMVIQVADHGRAV